MKSKQQQPLTTTKANANKTVEKIVPCPTCKKSVRWNEGSQYRPFCSKRCKLIDLGDWASEKHSIPSDNIHSDAIGFDEVE